MLLGIIPIRDVVESINYFVPGAKKPSVFKMENFKMWYNLSCAQNRFSVN